MYLYVGELEGIHRDSVQKHMVEYTKQVVHEIKQEGFSEANLLFETAAEGTHDVYFFSALISFVLFSGCMEIKIKSKYCSSLFNLTLYF